MHHIASFREHHDDPSTEGEGHELLDRCSALCPRPRGIDQDPSTSFGRPGDHRSSCPSTATTAWYNRSAEGDLGTMWCKIEENAKTCPCGRMTERWALVSKGKRIATVAFCRLCHPQLAHMLNHPLPIAPQRRRILAFSYGCDDVPDWTVRAQHPMGRLDPSVRIPAHIISKLDDEFEYWRATSCQRCRFLQCWGAPHSCKCYCHDTNGSKGFIERS
jgi:hypothetical protein